MMYTIYMAKNTKHRPSYPALHNRPLTYKFWNEKTISLAVTAVKEGHSQRRVAEDQDQH